MGIENVIRVSRHGEPGGTTTAPWDLSRYAPTGNGVGSMMIAMPWGAAPAQSPGYALHEHVWDPFRGAPISEGAGGTMYWDRISRADFDAVMRVLDVRTHDMDYLAYVERTRDIGTRAFATQLRIITGFALELFGGKGPAGAQPLAVGEALWQFMELERASTDVSGSLGGDGDWAWERVAFGFLVENSYFGVYRIWSRPWLITK